LQINSSKTILNSIRLPKHWFAFCLLIAITVQSLTPGVVLCFEDDGHLEVEFGSNGECCQPFDGNAIKSSSFISNERVCHSSCGLCVDIPLYISAEKKHNSKSLELDHLIALLHSSLCTASFIDNTTSINSFQSIPTTVYLISTIQTVILQV